LERFFLCGFGYLFFFNATSIFGWKKDKIDDIARQFFQGVISPEINFKIKNQRQINKIFQKIERMFNKNKINKIDGLTVFDKNFKFNLRVSHTEPNVLRLNIEAINEKVFKKYCRKLSN